MIVGIVESIFAIGIAAGAYLSGWETVIAAIVAPFSLVGVALIVAFVNCRITDDESGFTVRNFFRSLPPL